MLNNLFNLNITQKDVRDFVNKKLGVRPNPQTALNKQMTVNNAIANRGGQAPQSIPSAPVSDGFGRTV